MKSHSSARQKRRIGILLFLLGAVPLVLWMGILTAIRWQVFQPAVRQPDIMGNRVGGHIGEPRPDLGWNGDYLALWLQADRLPGYGYAPQIGWLTRTRIEISGELTRYRQQPLVLPASELRPMLTQHRERMIDAVSQRSAERDWTILHPTVESMIRDGQTRRDTWRIEWRNVPVNYVELVAGPWKLGMLASVMCLGTSLWTRNPRRKPWACLDCGYDLRGTPKDKPCPECGNAQITAPPNPSEP